MELLGHLLGRGRIRYQRGGWTLPPARASLALPESAEAAFRERYAALSSRARLLFEAQALASHAAFTRDDYAALAISAYVELLGELGEAAQGRAEGEAALALCQARGIESGVHAIARSTALCEIQLGALAAAAERVDRVIAAQRALGAAGLPIGISYEIRARIAIAAKDEAGAETYARLTALEYSHGSGSVIAGRYERLLDAAERAGVAALPALSDLRSIPDLTRAMGSRLAASAFVTREMRGAATAAQRAERALRMLCEAEDAASGRLYLFAADGRLQPAAALGALELGDGFEAWAAEYLEQVLTQSEDATAVEPEASASGFDTRPAWTGPGAGRCNCCRYAA